MRFTMVAVLLCLSAPAMGQQPAPLEQGAPIALTPADLAALIRAAQAPAAAPAPIAAPVPPPAPSVPRFALPAVPQVDTSTVPDPLSDASGFVAAVVKAISTHQWWTLIPLLLIGLVAGVRKFGGTLWGGFFTTPRGGAVLAIVAALGGSVYLSLQLGTTGLGPVLLMAGMIFVSAYPLFKLANNLLTNTGPVPGVVPPPVPAPPAVPPVDLASAAAAADGAAKVAAGATATELVDASRRPTTPVGAP